MAEWADRRQVARAWGEQLSAAGAAARGDLWQWRRPRWAGLTRGRSRRLQQPRSCSMARSLRQPGGALNSIYIHIHNIRARPPPAVGQCRVATAAMPIASLGGRLESTCVFVSMQTYFRHKTLTCFGPALFVATWRCAAPVLRGCLSTYAADTPLSSLDPAGDALAANDEASAWLRRRPAAQRQNWLMYVLMWCMCDLCTPAVAAHVNEAVICS